MELFKIECIGDGSPRAKPYGVWEILGLGINGELFRKSAVHQNKDYAKANSVGTRGVYAYYLLQSEHIYEIVQPTSWNNTEHYYLYIDVDEYVRLDIEGVLKWLKNRSV